MERIVLLHAFGSSHRSWRPQVEALGDRYRLDTPDLPGHGGAPGPFTLTRAVDAVDELIAAEPGMVHMVGISGGATVALLAAAARPERVSSLILSAPVAHPPRLLGIQRFMTWLLPQAVTLRFLTGLYSGGRVEHEAMAVEDFRQCGKNTYLDAMRQIAGLDARAQLRAVRAPCLVLVGQRDKTNIAPSAQVAAGITGAEFRTVDGAGHLWNLESPELFNRTVEDVIASRANSRNHE